MSQSVEQQTCFAVCTRKRATKSLAKCYRSYTPEEFNVNGCGNIGLAGRMMNYISLGSFSFNTSIQNNEHIGYKLNFTNFTLI